MTMGLQNTFVYRWNFLLRVLFAMVPLMGTFFLWGAVFDSPGATLGGYSFSRMVSYYLFLLLLDTLTSPTEDDFQIAGEIRDGVINQFLLRPVDYLAYRLSLFSAGRFIYAGVTLLPVLAAMFFLRAHLCLPESAFAWGLALVALALSALLQFLVAYCSALMAFWILDVSALIFVIFSIEYLAGGHAFPLDLLPREVYAALLWTPFPYEYWFPLGVFLERMTPAEAARGLLAQAAWCAVFYGLARWMWARGIRRYTAVGG